MTTIYLILATKQTGPASGTTYHGPIAYDTLYDAQEAARIMEQTNNDNPFIGRVTVQVRPVSLAHGPIALTLDNEPGPLPLLNPDMPALLNPEQLEANYTRHAAALEAIETARYNVAHSPLDDDEVKAHWTETETSVQALINDRTPHE